MLWCGAVRRGSNATTAATAAVAAAAAAAHMARQWCMAARSLGSEARRWRYK